MDNCSCNKEKVIDRLLEVMEKDIVPKTMQGVKSGNKLFGAAIVKKSDLSLVLAETNNETENPLWHGEIHTLKKLYEMPRESRPAPRDCIFFATHEPCSLCLSAITWGGYDNFYYLFSYTDSKDSFNIPHDLKMLKEVFKCDHGSYAKDNYYWHSHSLIEMIKQTDPAQQDGYMKRVEALKKTYDEMSDIYQQSKGDNEIPLN